MGIGWGAQGLVTLGSWKRGRGQREGGRASLEVRAGTTLDHAMGWYLDIQWTGTEPRTTTCDGGHGAGVGYASR